MCHDLGLQNQKSHELAWSITAVHI